MGGVRKNVIDTDIFQYIASTDDGKSSFHARIEKYMVSRRKGEDRVELKLVSFLPSIFSRQDKSCRYPTKIVAVRFTFCTKARQKLVNRDTFFQ